jgi:hypothetical protein
LQEGQALLENNDSDSDEMKQEEEEPRPKKWKMARKKPHATSNQMGSDQLADDEQLALHLLAT